MNLTIMHKYAYVLLNLLEGKEHVLGHNLHLFILCCFGKYPPNWSHRGHHQKFQGRKRRKDQFSKIIKGKYLR